MFISHDLLVSFSFPLPFHLPHTFPPLPARALYLRLFTLLNHTDTKPVLPGNFTHKLWFCLKCIAGRCLKGGGKDGGKGGVWDPSSTDKSALQHLYLRFKIPASTHNPQLISFTSKWLSF